jgi:predicted transcriptional regulator of viral defense system
VRLRSGLYTPVPLDSEADATTLEEPWALVPELFSPGFVTGWSAAEHWDLTEQLFRRICVKTAVDVRRKLVRVREVELYLTHVPEDQIFGTEAYWAGAVRVDVADRHRTVVDMLDDPALGGGGSHTASCVEAYLGSEGAEPSRLIEYGDRLGNGAVFKRLGFLAERSLGSGAQLVEACRSRLTKGYADLDPSMDCPRVVSRWRLRVPALWVRGGEG